MNPAELTRLSQSIQLSCDQNFLLRVDFGVACSERVLHLVTAQSIVDCLKTGREFIRNAATRLELDSAARQAKQLASSHPGSGSLDGAGSAAVSSSYGVAAALAGNALVAAEYSAYASVYSYAGFAVTDLSAYADEHTWQIRKLEELIDSYGCSIVSADNY